MGPAGAAAGPGGGSQPAEDIPPGYRNGFSAGPSIFRAECVRGVCNRGMWEEIKTPTHATVRTSRHLNLCSFPSSCANLLLSRPRAENHTDHQTTLSSRPRPLKCLRISLAGRPLPSTLASPFPSKALRRSRIRTPSQNPPPPNPPPLPSGLRESPRPTLSQQCKFRQTLTTSPNHPIRSRVSEPSTTPGHPSPFRPCWTWAL